MSLEDEVSRLKDRTADLERSHGGLKDHVEKHVNPALDALQDDMTEIRTTLTQMGTYVATTRDIISLSEKIDASNANMAAALASVPADQANRVAYSNLWWTGIMSVATVGMLIYAILKH